MKKDTVPDLGAEHDRFAMKTLIRVWIYPEISTSVCSSQWALQGSFLVLQLNLLRKLNIKQNNMTTAF